MMVAQVCDRAPGDFVHTLGDAHLYVNHQQQADLQLQREPLALPTLKINPAVKDLFAFRFEDFELVGYEATQQSKAPEAVQRVAETKAAGLPQALIPVALLVARAATGIIGRARGARARSGKGKR